MAERKERRASVDAFTIFFASGLVAAIAAIALPRFLEARRHGNEASAIGALKTIATAEAVFREGDKENDGNLDYGMLSELLLTRLVDSELASGTKKGYEFQATYSFTTSEFLWFGVASPQVPGSSGTRYFEENQAGVIFYTTAARPRLDTCTCSLPHGGPLPRGKGG